MAIQTRACTILVTLGALSVAFVGCGGDTSQPGTSSTAGAGGSTGSTTSTTSTSTTSTTTTSSTTGTGGSGGVGPVGNGPLVFFSAYPGVVAQGGATTLSWSAPGATSCSASGAWTGDRAPSGVQALSNITANGTYELTCSNAAGSTVHGVRVQVTTAATRAYLEDGDVGYAEPPQGAPSLAPLGWPRVALVEGPVLGTNAEWSTKYDAISTHVWEKAHAAATQAKRPELLYFWHVAPAAQQVNNMPFTATGPATVLGAVKGEGTMYAGHWLYFVGTTSKQPLSAAGTTLQVQDASMFKAGQYVVIYDAPAGSFANAEHARVKQVNISTGEVELSTRGYRSVASSHPANSIVAPHKLGWGALPDAFDVWAYNLSAVCPKDANGRTFADLEVDWIAANLNKDADGAVVPGLRVDGVYFDADPYWAKDGGTIDIDNDLVADDGIDAGQNLWGKGMEAFFKALSDKLPGKILVGGDRYTRGQALSGTQMESCPADTYGNPQNPTYKTFGSLLAVYSYRLHHSRRAPEYTDVFNRISTKLYPIGGATVSTNKAFRIAFGFTLLDDGFYANEDDQGKLDPWWDEFAVDLTPGSTYGQGVDLILTPSSAACARASA